MQLASFVYDFGQPVFPFWEYAILAAQALVLFFTLYHALLIPAGFWVRRSRSEVPPEKSFAILIPAHNEEAVIGELLDNLEHMHYPRYLYDVYVIADNCTDGTTAVTRARGAQVIERFDPERRGKGYALDHAIRWLWRQPRHYDAVVILDADNLASPDFLRAMNARLCRGERVIQGYLDVKNPNDTWVSACFAISYWASNRFWCLAKNNLGFTVPLGGTGMCIDADLLREIGWGAATLTEDLEFAVRAALHGVRTTWAHEAAVYDEKPLTFAQSWRQRLRWVQGGVQVALLYLPIVLAEGIRRRDPVLLECALMVCRPFYLTVASLFGLSSFLAIWLGGADPRLWDLIPRGAWYALGGVQFLLPILAMALDRVPLRPYRFLLLFPLFAYSWIPLTCLGVFRSRHREWSHTQHTRGISYRELLQDRSAGLGI